MFCCEKDCKEPVAFSFVWPWGKPDACCSRHRTVVQQRSDALDRGPVNFTVLEPNKPQSITRDERTQLIAAKMSAEQETADVKARAQELYHSNTQLADDVRRLRARNLELESQLRDLNAKLDTVLKERDTALADAHDSKLETERMSRLVPHPTEPPPPLV